MERAQIDSFLQFAVQAAEDAGPIALQYFRRRTGVSNKAGGGFFDPVTAADREIESRLRAEIGRIYPDHGIIGEEHGVTASAGGLSWVIDPIDGTRAFISGMPAWGIMIGLVEEGRPLLGVVHQPFTGETFSGDGATAWLRSSRDGSRAQMRARPTRRIGDAVLYCTHPSMFREAAELAAFERVTAACRMMRYGGDCYAYCLLALGEVDLVVESGLQPYDILPLMPILEGAGAVVTDWEGKPPLTGGRVAVAATPKLHAELLAVLTGA